MKIVHAIIKPFKRAEVIDALLANGNIAGITTHAVSGFGSQAGHTEIYRGSEYETNVIAKDLLSVIVLDEHVEETIRTIIKSAKTGKIGDGIVWEAPVEDFVRIRTEERGEYALASRGAGGGHLNEERTFDEAKRFDHQVAGNQLYENTLVDLIREHSGYRLFPQTAHNEITAATFHREQAMQGCDKAALLLGYCFHTGRGVVEDYAQAHAWYNVAAALKSDARAKRMKDELAAHMSPDALGRAHGLAQEYIAEINIRKGQAVNKGR